MSQPPQNQPPPGYLGGPPAAHPGAPPPGYPGPPPENPKAKRLVNLSTLLGWGGIGMMFLLAPIIGIAVKSFPVGAVLCGLGFASAIAGAIVGQIGRAMQGRVI